MRPKFAAAVAGVILAVFAATGADACSRNVSKKAASTIVPASGINESLLDAAIRTEVNFHRCRAGLKAVGDAGSGMGKQARIHSQWMAKTRKLSHNSNMRGSATLQQRVRAAGIKARTGSENIGMVHRYQLDNRRFKILNFGACQFSTYEGQPLGAHTYASLARHIVTLWMNSSGHRKNILDRRVSRHRVSIAFDGKAPYCGQFWITQNFVG